MESKEDSVKQNIVYIRPTQTEISMVQNNPIVGGAMSALDLSAGSDEIYKTLRPNIKSEMRSFKSNENIHKKEGGSYYVVSANKASSVIL